MVGSVWQAACGVADDGRHTVAEIMSSVDIIV
jgi:hypothetical protein